MDFDLSADQVALQEGIRNLCDGRFDIAAVRGMASGGIDRTRWTDLADMGVFALRLAEADGGVGLGWADTVLAYEELGRALVPGPVVWTQLAAGLVPGASDGSAVVTGVERDDPSRLIEHLVAADRLLVLDDQGASLVDPASVEVEGAPLPLDPLTPVSQWVGELPPGERIAGPEVAEELRLRGALLVAALQMGLAVAATELSVAFAGQRVQFDRPIGSFQAVKHILADMFTVAELARAAVYAAGVTLDDPEVGSAARAIAAAKVTANDAATANGRSCIQVHGGMGYTWEVDAHLFLKRAYALAPSFGSSDAWADHIALTL